MIALRPLVIHEDERGSVREAYRASWGDGLIRQIVHSESKAGVLRGMHAHRYQTDVWHFTAGRAQVQTYDHETGEWQNIVVDGEHTIVIPPGVSHGFLALTDVTLTYFLTEEYNAANPDEHEWNALDKKWPGGKRWKQANPDASRIVALSTIAAWKRQLGDYSGVPDITAPLIRSQRDIDAPSLAEFAAAW